MLLYNKMWRRGTWQLRQKNQKKHNENKLIQPTKKRLKACAMLSIYGVEEMMRNASCFVLLLLVNEQFQFPKGKWIKLPYLYFRVTLVWASKYPPLHANAHKMVNLVAPNCDCQVMWNEINLFGQSLHQAYHCILSKPPLLQWTILGPHKNYPTPRLQ